MRFAFANHVFTWHPHQRGGQPPPRRDRRRQIAWIAQAGFDGVEMGDFWMDFYRESDAGLRSLRAEFADDGVPIVALNCLRKAVTPPPCAAANQAALRRAVEVANIFGAKIVSISLAVPHALLGQETDLNRGQRLSIGGSAGAPEADYTAAAEFLAGLADTAAAAGIQLSLELHHNSIADTGRSTARLVRAVNRPNVGANPDLGNLVWSYDTAPESYQEALLTLLDVGVNFWHVKNVHRVHVPEVNRAAFVQAPLGEGLIDYRWCLMAAHDAGYDGWLSLEGAGPGDCLAIAERGLGYAKRLLDDLRAIDSLGEE